MARRKRILLAQYTGGADVIEHFDILANDLGYEVVVGLPTKVAEGQIKGPFDLIVQMGLGREEKRLEGLRHVARIRELYPKPPFLVVSGHDPSYAREQVIERGANEFLQRHTDTECSVFVQHVQKLLISKTAPS